MTFTERAGVFWRLHFLQLLWNFKGMQNMGYLYVIRPILRRLYSGEEYNEAERRHIKFFNTHPYFACICIGVIIKFEEELKEGTFKKPEMIPVLKNRMSGPLAAVGDTYFWETLIPVLSSIAVLGVYLFGPGNINAIYTLGIVLGVYILSVELIRWQGVGWGYEHGLGVVELLKRKDFQGSMKRIRNAAALMLGMATVIFILKTGGEMRMPLIRVGVMAGMVIMTLKRISPTIQLYTLCTAGFLYGMIQ